MKRQLLLHGLLRPSRSRMVSQGSLLNGGPLSFTLCEEYNPPEAIDGETRTRNVPANQSQREVVIYREVASDFSVSVEMPLIRARMGKRS